MTVVYGHGVALTCLYINQLQHNCHSPQHATHLQLVWVLELHHWAIS
jgi:hypothetical protein